MWISQRIYVSLNHITHSKYCAIHCVCDDVTGFLGVVQLIFRTMFTQLYLCCTTLGRDRNIDSCLILHTALLLLSQPFADSSNDILALQIYVSIYVIIFRKVIIFIALKFLYFILTHLPWCSIEASQPDGCISECTTFKL